MSSEEDYIDALRQRPQFDDLEEEELEELVEAAESRTLLTGDALWSRGDEGDGAFVLISGRIELTYQVQPDGKRQVQYDDPGVILGAAHLIHDWEHESSAFPRERSEVLKIEREAFQRLFDERHPAAYRVVDALAEQLVEEVRDANQRLQEVFGRPAETLRMLRRRARDR